MHTPRTQPHCFDFYGLSVDAIDTTSGLLIANLGSLYDEDELAVARALIKPGDRVLVAGSGSGGVSAILSMHVGRDNVVSYEANPEQVASSRAGVQVEGRALDVHHAAVSDHTGEVVFYIDDNFVLSSTMHLGGTSKRAVNVPCVHINEALLRHNCNFLMLDIEFGEHVVLPALDYSLLTTLVVELHGQPEELATLQSHITSGGMAVTHQVGKGQYLRIVGATR